MKNTFFFLVLLITFSTTAQNVTIDETASMVLFTFVDDDVKGSIEGFDFNGNFDPNDLSNSILSGSVVTETLDSNNWLRTRHLRSKKYFSAKAHPKLTFSNSTLIGTKDGFTATGTLTIKGISRIVVWSFMNADNILSGTASINTQDFDISIHDEKERNRVIVSILMPYK